MSTVKISSKYQVVIPKEIRESNALKPGMSLQILTYNDRIELIPVGDIKKLRGIAKGIDTTVDRG